MKTRRVLSPLVEIGELLRREGITDRAFQKVARELATVVEIDAVSLVPRGTTLTPFVWFARGVPQIPDAPSAVKAALLEAAHDDIEPQSARSFEENGIQWIAIPLAVDPNELLGALALARRGPPLSEKELAFLSCVSHHVAYALARTVTQESEPSSSNEAEMELVAEAPNILFASLDHGEAVNHLAHVIAERLDCRCTIEFGDGDHHRLISVPSTPEEEIRGDWRMRVPLITNAGAEGSLTVSGRHRAPSGSAIRQLAARIAQAITNGRLYRDAENAVASRDRLLATVSHDLRNPLGVILMTVNHILSEAPQSDRRTGHRRKLEAIRRSAERMNMLVQDLLELATMESGRFTMNPNAQDVSALLGDVIEAVAGQAESTATRMVVAPADGLPQAWVDRHRLVQVLTNLVGNAIKFAAGTEVHLRATPCVDGIAISVTDLGPGIAPAELPHVFERFWRSASTERPGSGLGLAIAKAIVDQYGGRIWLESEVGKGTTAVVTVPTAAL